MIVLVLSCCPSSLRGDITKWMFELDTNVFIGKMSARTRDLLWERVVRSCGEGRAIMAYGVDNEQRFDFRTHNSDSEPIDFDGLRLMVKPNTEMKSNKKMVF